MSMRWLQAVWVGVFGGWLRAQEGWQAFRPLYRTQPLVSAERPRLRDATAFQIEWRMAPALQALYERVLETYRTATTLPGYRVQVIATTNRTLADSVRIYLMENFPEVPVYRFYEVPTYKIRVGDFLERRAAEQWLEQHRREFPGAFVVPDQVLRR